MSEPHKDTTGDYEGALSGLVSGNNGLTADHPAPIAVKHPWLAKLAPKLAECVLSFGRVWAEVGTNNGIGAGRLTTEAHLGNYVAANRGPNPNKIFESMPIYVRIGWGHSWIGDDFVPEADFVNGNSMHLLYSEWDHSLLGTKRIQQLLKDQSIAQGKAFDSEAGAQEHIKAFIATYNIDTSQLLKPNPQDYKTFNQFFYRELRPDARPIDAPEDPKVISSAADCRLTVFQNVDLAKQFWIKGKGFTIGALLGDESLAAEFEGGELAIFRLSPADYHRYNSPVECVVGPTRSIQGDYYTVNPVTVNESNCNVFTQNRRDVTVLSMPIAGDTPADVAFVQIGAMLVGTIVPTKLQGSHVKRGEELGYFAYGGSTIVAVFPAGKVQWDQDLVNNSQVPIETAVRVGERIGTFL
ncbi:phosphatidylserine decarboxylase, partial [Phenoliferia sp. Uapishka_3]